MMYLSRSCIYTKDVQRITGKSERAAERMLSRIRVVNGKDEGKFVTVDEFAEYTGIDAELVRQYIVD